MLTLNLMNVDKIIFQNKQLIDKLPELRAYVDQWSLSVQHPFLRSMGKQAILDFIDKLNENHIRIISEHFNMSVTIDKLNNRLVENHQFKIEELEKELNNFEGFTNIVLYRNKEQCYISSWR